MKPSEITQQQFDDWKEDLRNLFDDEHDQYNLTYMMLKGLDEANSVEEVAKYNKRLFESYLTDLTRSGELECENCGNKMTIYYNARCFHCQKPEGKIKTEYEFYPCVYWLENNEEDFNREYFWEILIEHEILEGNDRPIQLPERFNDPEQNEQLELFNKHFPVKDATFFVSW